MKKIIKNIMGYMVIPNLLLFSVIYFYYFSFKHNDFMNEYLFFALLFAIVYFAGLKVYSPLNFIYYNGYGKARNFVYFVYYYIGVAILFTTISKASPEFYKYFGLTSLLLVSALIFVIQVCVSKIGIKVKFLQITPRLYVDLVHRQLHTKEMINTYSIQAILDEQLTYVRNFEIYNLVQQNQLKYLGRNNKITPIANLEYQIIDNEYVNFEAFDKDDNIIWSKKFYDKEMNESKAMLLHKIIFLLENS